MIGALIAVVVWVGVVFVTVGVGLVPSAVGGGSERVDLHRMSSVGLLRRSLWRGLPVVVAAGLVLALIGGADAYIRPAGLAGLLLLACLGYLMGIPYIRDAKDNWEARSRPALVVLLVGLLLLLALGWALGGAGDRPLGLSGSWLGTRPFFLTSLAPIGAGGATAEFAALLGLIVALGVADLALRTMSRRPGATFGLSWWLVTVGVVASCVVPVAVPGMRALGMQGISSTVVLVFVAAAYLVDYWRTPTKGSADASAAAYAAAPAVILTPVGVVVLPVVIVVVLVRVVAMVRRDQLSAPVRFVGRTMGPPLLWAVVLAILDIARGVGIL